MADNKKNIKTFEYEEGFPTPQGEVVEQGEVEEVIDKKEEVEEVEEVSDDINLDWGVLYTFNMYK